MSKTHSWTENRNPSHPDRPFGLRNNEHPTVEFFVEQYNDNGYKIKLENQSQFDIPFGTVEKETSTTTVHDLTKLIHSSNRSVFAGESKAKAALIEWANNSEIPMLGDGSPDLEHSDCGPASEQDDDDLFGDPVDDDSDLGGLFS